MYVRSFYDSCTMSMMAECMLWWCHMRVVMMSYACCDDITICGHFETAWVCLILCAFIENRLSLMKISWNKSLSTKGSLTKCLKYLANERRREINSLAGKKTITPPCANQHLHQAYSLGFFFHLVKKTGQVSLLSLLSPPLFPSLFFFQG